MDQLRTRGTASSLNAAPLRLALALLAAYLAATTSSLAAPWRSALYPETVYAPSAANLETEKVLQDFSYAGYHRGEAPIPDVAGPVFNAAAAPYSADPTGAADATAAIQAAINAAGLAGGGVVLLPAGTYRLSVATDRTEALLLDKPGVVLRGAGTEHTFLLNTTHAPMRNKAVIRVRGHSSSRFVAGGTHEIPLAADVLNSTATIPVASTTPFSPGDTVVVRNTIGDAWITEHGEPEWLGQGHLFGGLTYRRTVLAVDSVAGTLTLDAPLRYSLKLRDSARVVRLSVAPLAEIGLEDFSFANLQHPGDTWAEGDYDVSDAAAHDVHGSFFIMIERARDCWVRRLATYQPAANTTTAHLLSGALSIRDATRVTIADCVFQRPQYGGGGGNGYMFRLIHAAECLIMRSEARFSRHGFMVSGIGSSGNVIHDCLDAETGRATGSTGFYTTAGKGSDHHMHFSQANLFDLCTGEDSWFEARYRPAGSEPRHNITAVHSVFWNTRGTGSTGGAIVRSEQARYGYVIGTSGPRSAVLLPRLAPAGTDPIDHVEGEGLGEQLIPQSLFLDQRAVRLGPDLLLPAEPVLPHPADTVEIHPLGFTLGGSPVPASALDIAWSAPLGVVLTPLQEGGVLARVPGSGAWNLSVTLTAAGQTRTRTLRVVASPSAPPAPRTLNVAADSFIEGGTAADTNNGTLNTLRLKRAAGPSTTRHGLLRFDLAALGEDLPVAARLVLTSQRDLATYSGWQIAVRAIAPTPAWTETGVTWNNAPAFGETIATYAPSPSGLDIIDLSAPLLAAFAAAAPVLELGLVVLSQPDTSIHYYHSREQTNPALRPRIELDVIPAIARFEHWIETHEQISPTQRAPLDDPDGDGVPNLLEMALARDPSHANHAPPLALIDGSLRFTLADVFPAFNRLRVEHSTDLHLWHPVGIEPGHLEPAGVGAFLVTRPVSLDAPRAFWRLRVEPE